MERLWPVVAARLREWNRGGRTLFESPFRARAEPVIGRAFARPVGASRNGDRKCCGFTIRRSSGFALGDVFAHDAFVPLQLPLVIRAVGEPFGDADLGTDLTGSHGDA
jgi:hypothetical protein